MRKKRKKKGKDQGEGKGGAGSSNLVEGLRVHARFEEGKDGGDAA